MRIDLWLPSLLTLDYRQMIKSFFFYIEEFSLKQIYNVVSVRLLLCNVLCKLTCETLSR